MQLHNMQKKGFKEQQQVNAQAEKDRCKNS
jgi:hypothetical protein